MSDNSAIEWTDATWNPTVGCSIVSPGCTNCYAMKMAARLEAMGQPIYKGMTQASKAGAVWTGKVELSNHGQLIKPLSWKKPRRIFVNSMSDLFHESLSDEAIDKVFAVMALCPQHTFQVLTKRAERMRDYLNHCMLGGNWAKPAVEIYQADGEKWRGHFFQTKFPLPNVWLGVSTERQQEADERIPLLLRTPAAVRFISAEPLLGTIDLVSIARQRDWPDRMLPDWVIVGGESGPNARPMHPQWARDIRDQCAGAGVPFFFKQWGAWIPTRQCIGIHGKNLVNKRLHHWPDHSQSIFAGKKAAGRLLDGREHNEFPNAVTVESVAA